MVTINVTFGLVTATISFAFFLFIRHLIAPLTYFRLYRKQQDNQTISTPTLRTCFTYTDEERWQRLNLLISWLHALITGVLVLYSFLVYRELHQDFVEHVNFVTYVTCSLSFGMLKEKHLTRIFLYIEGYFWYDLCDVISNRRGSDLYEIVLHHIVVSIN